MPYEYNYYDFNGCNGLAEKYKEMTSKDIFIQNDFNNRASEFYKKAGDVIYAKNGRINLGVYPHLYGSDFINVIYYLDGDFIHSVNHAPYALDFHVTNGTHKLHIVAQSSNGKKAERDYTIISEQGTEQSEEINTADTFTDSNLLNNAQKEAGYNSPKRKAEGSNPPMGAKNAGFRKISGVFVSKKFKLSELRDSTKRIEPPSYPEISQLMKISKNHPILLIKMPSLLI